MLPAYPPGEKHNLKIRCSRRSRRAQAVPEYARPADADRPPSCQVHPDRLRARVSLERVERHFLAPATLSEAAEGTREIVAAVAVYEHHPRIQAARNAVRSRDITRVEPRRKCVLARVGK